MVQKIMTQPANGIVFVYGDSDVEVPADRLDRRTSLIAASDDALIVCVKAEVDGETELTVGASSEIDPGWTPAFVGFVNTPFHLILVETVDQRILVRQDVALKRTALRVWFSHPRWPDRVLIGID